MYYLDGKRLPLNKPFEHAGIRYPANWLTCSTAQQRAEIGIEDRPDPVTRWYDQRFYWGYDQDGNLIPKDHAELAKNWIAQTRQTANSLLTPSDWMVVREADNGTVINADWKAWRESVRLAANEKVLYIGTTNDTDELAAYITDNVYPPYSVWPNDPDHPPVASDDPVDDGVVADGDGADAGPVSGAAV